MFKPEYLYIIITKNEYIKFKKTGKFTAADQDKKDDFIHLSQENQLQEVIDKFYSDRNDLLCAQIKISKLLKHIKWEGKNKRFPHLYSDLPYMFIKNVYPIEN